MEQIERRRFQFDFLHLPRGQRATQGPDAFAQVLHLRRVLRRPEKFQLLDDLIRDRNVEPVAHFQQIGCIHLLLLMGCHAPLSNLAESVAFDRFRQDHRRLVAVLEGPLVRVVDLYGIVPATAEGPDFVVAQMLDQFQQLRILAEKFFADVSTALGAEDLILTVDALMHSLEQ